MLLQILDEKQEFTRELTKYMDTHWNLKSTGFEYNVVAVFGSQSTGKSTLLNNLFGTTFEVMSGASRQQTTKGLWLSKAHNLNLLILDVEGTDGRERGEDTDFERKSALFSLAIAQVLVVNIWETAVGLYNGANMGLLKTVLEVNLSLFQAPGYLLFYSRSPKTLLLFTIRDFTGNTQLSSLGDTLLSDLEKIWSGISKPTGRETCLITDFFDFSFSALPHKIYAADSFQKSISILSNRFSDKSDPSYIFHDKYKKNIPADGFSRFASTIWERISNNRDLDIPSQQQLLAQYRCDEIGRTSFELFINSINETQRLIESGSVVQELGVLMKSLKNSNLDVYDLEASRYHNKVYLLKRQEYSLRIDSTFKLFYFQQLKNLHKKSIASFILQLNDKLSANEPKFISILVEIQESIVSNFKQVCESSLLENVDWSHQEATISFLEDVENIADKRKSEAIESMVKSIESFIKIGLSEPIQVLLIDCNQDLWGSVFQVYKNVVSIAIEKLNSKSAGFEVSSSQLSTTRRTLLKYSVDVLLKIVKEECNETGILSRLKRVFEMSFKYDGDGVPKLWKPSDDIDAAFATAKEKTEGIFDLFSRIAISTSNFESIGIDFIDEPTLLLMSPLKLSLLRDRFKREIDNMFIEAKRSTVATTAEIPSWFIILTILLGWNEFYLIISNPIYFLTLAMMCGGGYFLYLIGGTGPAFAIIKATFIESSKQAFDALEKNGITVEAAVDQVQSVFSSPAKNPEKKGVETIIEEDEN